MKFFVLVRTAERDVEQRNGFLVQNAGPVIVRKVFRDGTSWASAWGGTLARRPHRLTGELLAGAVLLGQLLTAPISDHYKFFGCCTGCRTLRVYCSRFRRRCPECLRAVAPGRSTRCKPPGNNRTQPFNRHRELLHSVTLNFKADTHPERVPFKAELSQEATNLHGPRLA